mgnify:CR=1 FL=1
MLSPNLHSRQYRARADKRKFFFHVGNETIVIKTRSQRRKVEEAQHRNFIPKCRNNEPFETVEENPVQVNIVNPKSVSDSTLQEIRNFGHEKARKKIHEGRRRQGGKWCRERKEQGRK